MEKFILKTAVFSLIVIGVFLWVCSRANGYTDPFYVRFTTPKQSSLILGTSRAAQGLQPRVFDSLWNEKISNYSFTVLHSPFGDTYLNSIKKKLDPTSENSTFILTVDPWSIASLTEVPNDSLMFRERSLALANTAIVNIDPNPIYIMNNWESNYYNLLNSIESNLFLHKDGWLEVDINQNKTRAERNLASKIKMYRQTMLPKAHFSANRYRYLKETIHFLKQHGDVYLVRLPIHSEMMAIEIELMPNFNTQIKEAIALSDGYLDLTPQNDAFNYTDGNHLHKDSGKVVSSVVAKWIKAQKKTQKVAKAK